VTQTKKRKKRFLDLCLFLT